jgi:hypothetical protein
MKQFRSGQRAQALLIVLVYSAIPAAGCSQGGAASAAPIEHTSQVQRAAGPVRAQYDPTGRLQKIEYDRNGDGKADAWGYMDGSRVVRVEVDEDADGRVDRWEYHREAEGAAASTPGVDPTLERIERSTGHDGRINRWEYFTNGVLSRVEEDTNQDGKIDKWETYVNGVLSTMALDTQSRGKPDRRLVYGSDGSLTRIEADPTGSGAFAPLNQ